VGTALNSHVICGVAGATPDTLFIEHLMLPWMGYKLISFSGLPLQCGTLCEPQRETACGGVGAGPVARKERKSIADVTYAAGCQFAPETKDL
jgi:hypothetical protein